MFQVDSTVEKLKAYAIGSAALGDVERASIAAAMLELYLAGQVDITFDQYGEPTAAIIEQPSPVVAFPMFSAPDMVPAQAEKRRIGFSVDRPN